MPARSQAQMKLIYALREQYKKKSAAPKDAKWAFDKVWTKGVAMKALPEHVPPKK